MKKSTISIIGGGEIGSAIYHLLSHQKDTVYLFDTDPQKTKADISVKNGLKKSEFIFLCIPSEHFTEVLDSVRIHADNNALFISLTKGFSNNGMLTSQILREKVRNFALISGPMLAEEIMENKIALGIVASKTEEAYSALSDIFAGTPLSLGFSPHVEEIALLGVLKNIYTLAVGISTEFKKSESSWGDNAHGYIISKCIQEMHDIFNEKQLNTQVIKTIAGIGDFITTSSSIHSSNCVAGMQLARGEKPKKCEGIRSLDLLNNKIPIHEYPLLNSLYKIIYAEGDPYSTIKQTVAI